MRTSIDKRCDFSGRLLLNTWNAYTMTDSHHFFCSASQWRVAFFVLIPKHNRLSKRRICWNASGLVMINITNHFEMHRQHERRNALSYDQSVLGTLPFSKMYVFKRTIEVAKYILEHFSSLNLMFIILRFPNFSSAKRWQKWYDITLVKSISLNNASINSQGMWKHFLFSSTEPCMGFIDAEHACTLLRHLPCSSLRKDFTI